MAVAAPGVIIKNAYQIRHIRTACEMLKQVHDHLRTIIRPGVSTGELDAIAERMIRKMGGIPAFKGYRGGRGVPDFRPPSALPSTKKSYMASRATTGSSKKATSFRSMAA